MKINAPVKINISELKLDLDPSVKVEDIKKDLKAEGATVAGYRDDDGTLVMVISGDIETEQIEAVFDEDAHVDFNEYVIDEIDLVDVENVEVFDNKNVKKTGNVLSEKKTGCCPPKKVKTQKQNMVSLSEAFEGKKVEKKKVTLDNVIDDMAGHKITESVAVNALNKAKKEAKNSYLVEKLGTQKYKKIVESLESDKKSMHGDITVNKKKIADYTTDELVTLLEKVGGQIEKLEAQIGAGLNETDEALTKQLEMKKKIQTILDEEISYREALDAIHEDDDVNFDFKDLNPETVDSDDKKDEDKDSDDHSESDEDKKDDDTDDEKNPDEDEVTEINSITITMASKADAEDLKNDLLDADVPEDAIEIAPVEDESDEDDKDSDEDDTDNSDDENTDENGDSESDDDTNESVKVKSGKKINEDDGDEENSDENADDDSDDAETADTEDNDSDSDEDEEAEGSYKLILTNTDYTPQLASVLQDIWGMEKDEFESLIGGEIIEVEDDEDDSDENKDSDSDEDKGDGDDKNDSEDDADDFDDFDPDEIFKDL